MKTYKKYTDQGNVKFDKTKDFLDDLTKLDVIKASINQLGRSVYAFCKKRKGSV